MRAVSLPAILSGQPLRSCRRRQVLPTRVRVALATILQMMTGDDTDGIYYQRPSILRRKRGLEAGSRITRRTSVTSSLKAHGGPGDVPGKDDYGRRCEASCFTAQKRRRRLLHRQMTAAMDARDSALTDHWPPEMVHLAGKDYVGARFRQNGSRVDTAGC